MGNLSFRTPLGIVTFSGNSEAANFIFFQIWLRNLFGRNCRWRTCGWKLTGKSLNLSEVHASRASNLKRTSFRGSAAISVVSETEISIDSMKRPSSIPQNTKRESESKTCLLQAIEYPFGGVSFRSPFGVRMFKVYWMKCLSLLPMAPLLFEP